MPHQPKPEHDPEVGIAVDSWDLDPPVEAQAAPLGAPPSTRAAVPGKRKHFLPEVDTATPVHHAPLVVRDEKGTPYHLASGKPLMPSVHQDLKGAPEGTHVTIPGPPRNPTFGVDASLSNKLAAPSGPRQPPPRAARTSAATPAPQRVAPATPHVLPSGPFPSKTRTVMGDAFGPAAPTRAPMSPSPAPTAEAGSMSAATGLIEQTDLPALARASGGIPKLASLQATLAPSDDEGRVDPERAAAMAGVIQNQPFRPFNTPVVAGAVPGAFGKRPGPFGKLQPPLPSTTEYSPLKVGFLRQNLHWIVVVVVLVTVVLGVASVLSTTSARRRIERLNTQPPVVVAPQPPAPVPPPVRQSPPVVRPPAPPPVRLPPPVVRPPVVRQPAPPLPPPAPTLLSPRSHCGVREDGQPDGQATRNCCLLPETVFRQIRPAAAERARGRHGVWVRTTDHRLQSNAGRSLMVCGRVPYAAPVAWLP